MTTINVFVGQCGNQIGTEYMNRIINADLNLSDQQRFICVDTEPKVIRHVTSHLKKSTKQKSIISDKNLLYEQHGRGNNWGLGYNGLEYDEGYDEYSISSRTLERLRKESERCDIFSSILMLNSIGGGTGSGLTCKLLELIRDEYPLQSITNCAIVPSSNGETPLQYYNSALSLSKLSQYSDCIVLFHNYELAQLFSLKNKQLQRQRKQVSKNLSNNKTPVSQAYGLMNDYIANCLADTFLPIEHNSYNNQSLRPFNMSNFITNITPLPSNKFCELWSSSGLLSDYNQIIKNQTIAGKYYYNDQSYKTSIKSLYIDLLKRIPSSDIYNYKIKNQINTGQALSLSLYTRTTTNDDDDDDIKSSHKTTTSSSLINKQQILDDNQLIRNLKYKIPLYDGYHGHFFNYQYSTQPSSSYINIFHDKNDKQYPIYYKKSVSLAVNRNRINNYLYSLLYKATSMYNVKSYVHWYNKAGVSNEDFDDAFYIIRDIIDNYTYMTS